MKNNILALSIVVSLLALSNSANADSVCGLGITSCSIVSPNLGDTDQSADGAVSKSNQNNPSSNSNQSGNYINPDNRDANNNSNDGSITGGNTTSTGGNTASIGNRLDNVHGGSVGNTSTGASTAKNGDMSGSFDANNSNKGYNTLDNNTSNKQGQSSNNSNKVSGSTQGQSSSNLSASSSSNTMGKSGNSRTNTFVDAGDRSTTNYSSQALVRAPIIHGGVISIPSATMNTIVGECSPIPRVETFQVNGTHIGLFRNKNVPLGFTQQVSPNMNAAPFNYYTAPDGALYEMGVKMVITISVNNVGSSRSASMNVSRALGEDAGLGGSNSSSMQRQVTTTQSVPCVHSIFEPKQAPKPEPKKEVIIEEQDFSYLEHGMKG